MKTVGLVIIVVSFCAFGWYRSREMQKRIAVRSLFCEWLALLEISLRKKDLTIGEFLEQSAADTAFEPLDYLPAALDNLQQTRSMSAALCDAFKKSSASATFQPQELAQISAFFGDICGFDEESVCLRAQNIHRSISARLTSESAELSGKSRLCMTLYCLLGFAIAVLLM